MPDTEAAFFSHPRALKPHQRRPWSMLKLPTKEQPHLGAEHGLINEGFNHKHDQFWDLEAVIEDLNGQEAGTLMCILLVASVTSRTRIEYCHIVPSQPSSLQSTVA